MTYNQSPHIRVRSGIYHFVRRVPADLQQHYRSDRVSISLRTKSARAASRSAVSISQRLDDYWHGLRLQKMDVPALHLVIDDEADVPDKSPTMMEAVECPSDIIDQIGGWTTTGIGHAFGRGYSVKILAKWMKKMECYC